MLKNPLLENRTRKTPVGHPRSKREGGPCMKVRKEMLGMWPGWPFLRKLPEEKVLVLWGARTPEKKLPSKDQKGGIQENLAEGGGTQAWRKMVGDHRNNDNEVFLLPAPMSGQRNITPGEGHSPY